jgi:hypothetical protein
MKLYPTIFLIAVGALKFTTSELINGTPELANGDRPTRKLKKKRKSQKPEGGMIPADECIASIVEATTLFGEMIEDDVDSGIQPFDIDEKSNQNVCLNICAVAHTACRSACPGFPFAIPCKLACDIAKIGCDALCNI